MHFFYPKLFLFGLGHYWNPIHGIFGIFNDIHLLASGAAPNAKKIAISGFPPYFFTFGASPRAKNENHGKYQIPFAKLLKCNNLAINGVSEVIRSKMGMVRAPTLTCHTRVFHWPEI